MGKKIVLAYSGGLDTSVILRWLIETYKSDVIAFIADLGQGEELEEARKKAFTTGARKVYVSDLREEFVRDFVFPMFRANAVYEGQYLLGTSIARPLIAKEQINIARKEKASMVSHGATGKGNDQVRFELSYYALNPSITVVAPWREWDLDSRESLIEFAKKWKIPVPVTAKKPYSSDRNLLHISFEGGILENPWNEPPEDMFVLTKSPEKAPDKPVYIEIDFKNGNPVQVNGKALKAHKLLEELNTIGGKNGIGRIDLVENRYVGMKSRGVYETPGGTIINIARRALETLTLDREVMHIRNSLIPEYSRMVYNGYWFSPEREMLQTLIDESQKNVAGKVRLKLYKGNCTVCGRKSSKSLYREEIVTFEKGSGYVQSDATGFIKLNSLRLKINTLVNKNKIK